MKASVVIPTRNRGEAILKTLKSVVDQVFAAEDYEVIVVDSSTDATVGLIRSFAAERKGPPAVRYLREERVGVHYARHAGAKAMSGNIYVQIEDDALADKNWLAKLLEVFEDSRIVCAGGRVLPQFEATPPAWMKPYYAWLTVYDLGETRVKAPFVTACNLAVRREALFKVGGFNPDIVGSRLVGNGEVGLVEKLQRAKLGEVVYVPDARIWHLIPQKRLTLDYMRWRVYNEGTGTVQSYFQRKRPGLVSLAALATRDGLHALGHKALAFKHQRLMDASYFRHELRYLQLWGQMEGFCRLAYDRSYRGFIGREDWMEA
jgi:glucosyl-dolichyl phosphate glucuronosyltransferase